MGVHGHEGPAPWCARHVLGEATPRGGVPACPRTRQSCAPRLGKMQNKSTVHLL